MVKSKKNINAFQKAMLSNTKMISVEEQEDHKEITKDKKKIEDVKLSGLNSEKLKILNRMSKKYGIDVDVLIEMGLDLFISLEEYWFTDKND